MLDACLLQKAHYLDISGEFDVMETIASRDSELKAAGVMAVCGVDMDVVPTDCLAMRMKPHVPDAKRLDIFIHGLQKLSAGTIMTMIESAGLPNTVRHGGRLVQRPAGSDRRKVNIAGRHISMVSLPWGDISTAWYSTGIPDIAVHLSLLPGTPIAIAMSRHFRWLMQSAFVQRLLNGATRRFVNGPTAIERAANRCEFVAEVLDSAGQVRRAYLRTRDSYGFTFASASAIASRVLGGVVTPGFQTPGSLLGADFVLEIGGSVRHDLD